jgi:hypothetical protein
VRRHLRAFLVSVEPGHHRGADVDAGCGDRREPERERGRDEQRDEAPAPLHRAGEAPGRRDEGLEDDRAVEGDLGR